MGKLPFKDSWNCRGKLVCRQLLEDVGLFVSSPDKEERTFRISPGAGLRACGHDANHSFEFSAVISGKVADQAMMVWELVVHESRSVVSNSLRPHGLYTACQAPLSVEFFRL